MLVTRESKILVSVVIECGFLLSLRDVVSKLHDVCWMCHRDKTEEEAELTEDQKVEVQQKENARSVHPLVTCHGQLVVVVFMYGSIFLLL